MFSLILLGPQRLRPTLAGVIDDLEISGSIAAITAGWQEREAEDEELREHLGGRTVNLRLYERAEEIFARDPTLFEAHRERQERLQELQDLYRVRLHHSIAAVRELMAFESDPSDLLAEQRREALVSLRRLDSEHGRDIEKIHRRHDESRPPLSSAQVRHHIGQLERMLEKCSAVAIAGGHVAVLLNRLRFLGLPSLLRDHRVIAWSAGAMCLGTKVVTFHDTPPQGPGDAEVLENGLGCYPALLPFPHARRRLRLDDPERVSLLASRFAPAACLALDEGTCLMWNGSYWNAPVSVPRLEPNGTVTQVLGDWGPVTNEG